MEWWDWDKVIEIVKMLMELCAPIPEDQQEDLPAMTAEEMCNCEWCEKRLDIALVPWRRNRFAYRAILRLAREDGGLRGRALRQEARQALKEKWIPETRKLQDHEIVFFCTEDCCEDCEGVVALHKQRNESSE